MITRATHVAITVQCDAPQCTTPPIETITETGLASILRGLGWAIAADGVHCWCPVHASVAPLDTAS